MNRDEARRTEENDQMEEFLKLIHNSVVNVKEILLSEPLLFEKPGKSKKNVDEFSEKFKTPLLEVLETENIITKNAEL